MYIAKTTGIHSLPVVWLNYGLAAALAINKIEREAGNCTEHDETRNEVVNAGNVKITDYKTSVWRGFREIRISWLISL